jgi:ABC-type spermidine/putrescine transport system permease subunit II
MEQVANTTLGSSRTLRLLVRLLLPLAGFGIALLISRSLLSSDVERLSLRLTLILSIEVTVICLCLAPLPVYAAFRYSSSVRLQRTFLGMAMIAFLVPTIARSLVISAFCSYYGPMADVLRTLRLWPPNVPLDSSHIAVVASLVTLYLPITVIVMAEGVRGLGKSPDTAATLGASPAKVVWLIVLPGLRRSATIAALLVFSQVLGVIVTPRILGSNDVTLAMLIDDLLKRQLDIHGAFLVAFAELILALPVAIIAASYLQRGLRSSRSILCPRDTAEWGAVVVAPFILILVALPIGLLVLAVVNSNVLALDHIISHGLTLHWFGALRTDDSLIAVIAPSVATWAAAALTAVGGGTLLAFFSVGRPRWRSVLEWAALLSLFIPQNVLAVVYSVFLDAMGSTSRAVPAWLLGGVGQSLPTVGVAIILVSRSIQTLESKLRIAATLGASPLSRLWLIVMPNIGTAVAGSLIAVTLVTLDDILFVRYLPGQSLDTFATELFARARYSASPELAAAVVIVLFAILAIAALLWLALRAPRGTNTHRVLLPSLPAVDPTR